MTAVDDILGALPAEQVAQQTGSTPDEVRTTAAAVLPALLGGLQANADDSAGAGSLLKALGQHDPDLLSGGADLARIDEQDGQAIATHIFGDQQDEVAARLGGLPGVGGSGAGGALVKKLIPILAPMVLSWLANRVLKGGGGSSAPSGSSGGGLGDVIGDVLGGGGARRSDPSSGGGASLPRDGGGSLPGGGGAAPGGLEDMLRDVLGGATGGRPTSGGSSSGRDTSGGGAAPGGFDAGSIITDVLGGILGGGRR